MGMSTEKYCTKSKLDISNLQCSNTVQSLQVVLLLSQPRQCCCLPPQATYRSDSNASEQCCLKMYNIKRMESVVFCLVVSFLSPDCLLA